MQSNRFKGNMRIYHQYRQQDILCSNSIYIESEINPTAAPSFEKI